jgi:hypothetical protein
MGANRFPFRAVKETNERRGTGARQRTGTPDRNPQE